MRKLSRLLRLSLVIPVVLIGIGETHMAAQAATTYKIKSARTEKSRMIVKKQTKLWAKPYQTGDKPTRTAGTGLTGKLMQVDQTARAGKRTYLRISRRGHNYGWVNATKLKTPKTVVLPYTYTSQLYPLYAPNACEAASLKMALSVKGLATKKSLKTIIKRMPKAKTPKKGFVGNPYTDSKPGEVRTIYPAPLAKYARTYGADAANITGASKSKLIREVTRGNAVVFAGSWHMGNGHNYHVLALVGYRRGAFRVADPYMQKQWPNKVFWVKTQTFMSVYHSRHSRAVVVR
ncbi:C39 family peptidase [Levilactobacillus huananensis]|uniref:C39 family peptidase n=1 Tax=Levilactobacillus huananensis TaxID=2486019 RepID=UPI000F769B47|nr:C39 family peptidase [Levilactobacillus huananensis]